MMLLWLVGVFLLLWRRAITLPFINMGSYPPPSTIDSFVDASCQLLQSLIDGGLQKGEMSSSMQVLQEERRGNKSRATSVAILCMVSFIQAYLLVNVFPTLPTWR
jgi:hypothetical protein